MIDTVERAVACHDRPCMTRSSMSFAAPRRGYARGPIFADRADELVRASAHWLRHTAGPHQADGGLDLHTVRDNLGHASLTTTSLYLHKEEDTRHRETVRGHRMNWGDTDPVEPPAQEPQR